MGERQAAGVKGRSSDRGSGVGLSTFVFLLWCKHCTSYEQKFSCQHHGNRSSKKGHADIAIQKSDGATPTRTPNRSKSGTRNRFWVKRHALVDHADGRERALRTISVVSLINTLSEAQRYWNFWGYSEYFLPTNPLTVYHSTFFKYLLPSPVSHASYGKLLCTQSCNSCNIFSPIPCKINPVSSPRWKSHKKVSTTPHDHSERICLDPSPIQSFQNSRF